MKNNNNNFFQELINVQEKNNILHKRLETMLNEVMDSVNTDETIDKLSGLNNKKDEINNEVDSLEKEAEEWRQTFIEENGREPSEEDR